MPGRKKPVEGAPAPEGEKVYKPAGHHAAGSIQPHMLYARKEIRNLIMEKLTGGLPAARVTDKEPFKYTVLDGQLYVNLKYPVLRREAKEIIDPVSEAIKKIRTEYREREGITRKTLKRSEYPAEVSMPTELEVLWKGGVLPSEARAKRGEVVVDDGSEDEELAMTEEEEKKSKAVLFTKFPLLALTSKMGCFSFNLPAGPATHFYGTCTASSFGFPMLEDKDRPRHSSEWFPLPEKEDGTIDYSKVDKSDWLCSGCYGLKGLYGSPLIFTMMECRKQWVDVMTQPRYRDDFVKMMIKAIRMCQAQSITSRYFLDEMGLVDQIWTVPDPAYFRIHDVGDVFKPGYMEAWFEVIRQCAHPMKVKKLGFTLPPIKFWMPSRMWLIPGQKGSVSDHFRCMGVDKACVPDNLTLRPSAAYFGRPAPVLEGAKGLAHGAGATGIGQALTDKDIQAAEKIVGKLHPNGPGWICPAYLAPEKLGGGGAEWSAMGGTRKGLQLVGGACVRAYGPEGELPAPKGPGCRACWDRPDLNIVYPEH